jgi:hypothetical protein
MGFAKRSLERTATRRLGDEHLVCENCFAEPVGFTMVDGNHVIQMLCHTCIGDLDLLCPSCEDDVIGGDMIPVPMFGDIVVTQVCQGCEEAYYR